MAEDGHTVKQFYVASGDNTPDFIAIVNARLQKGWELHAPMQIFYTDNEEDEAPFKFFQPMVKRKEE